MKGTFKRETPFEKRFELAKRISIQYPDRVPVIVEVAKYNKFILRRKKYLSPSDISVGGFLNEIRKQASIRPDEALFLFCGSNGGALVPTSNTMSQVYQKFKDEDGFLYMTVALENTFGRLHVLAHMTNDLLDNMLSSSSNVAKTVGINKWL